MKSFFSFLVCLLAFSHHNLFCTDLLERLEKLIGSTIRESQMAKTPVTAPENFQIATVDLQLLLLFHPRMSSFNFAAHSFIRPITDSSINSSYALRQRSIEADRLRQKSSEKEKNLEKQLARLRTEQELRKEEFIGEMNRAGFGGAKPERLREIEEKYLNDAANIQKKMEKIRSDFQIWRKNNLFTIFLSDEERNLNLKNIIEEVQQHISELAATNKTDIILNQSFLPPSDSTTNLQLQPNPKSVRISATSYNNYDYFLKHDGYGYDEEDLSYEKAAINLLHGYIDHYTDIRRLFTPITKTENRFFGIRKDFTKECLSLIWQKHSIPVHKQIAIMSALDVWRKEKL